MITASRRASATIAFFIPRCLAIFIAEALAIRGERIVAVGSNAEIDKHKGPSTRVVDLNHRTVIPGLIDNHAHYMRAQNTGIAKCGSTASHRTGKPSTSCRPDRLW
jgi:imidazolonepropionase-like amidohydrolase